MVSAEEATPPKDAKPDVMCEVDNQNFSMSDTVFCFCLTKSPI